jgi:hypothetical protein
VFASVYRINRNRTKGISIHPDQFQMTVRGNALHESEQSIFDSRTPLGCGGVVLGTILGMPTRPQP